MNEHDRDDWIQRYIKRFEEHGLSPESLGWGGGRERQARRFKASYEFNLFYSTKVNSILDVGCGFGDLGVWLSEIDPQIQYRGIDINPVLIEQGKERYNLDLQLIDVSNVPDKSVDLVVANGIFNYRMKHEEHEGYIINMISHFFRIARKGVAVDFMSTYVDFMHDNSFHCPESFIVNLVKKYTKRYVLRNDYLDYEYMVYGILPEIK